MKLIWSPLSLERVQEAADYIAQDDPNAAVAWVNALFDAVKRLELAPYSGRVVPEVRRPDIREIFYGKYRIIYRVGEEEVSILTLRHMRQHFEPEEITKD